MRLRRIRVRAATRIKLGTLVTSVAYRYPGVLVKTVTTLDVLSGGRMYLGVGAGAPWNVPPQGPGTAWEKTVGTMANLDDDPDKGLGEALVRLRELAGLGVDHAILGRRGPWTEESIATLASVLPEVHAMGVDPRR